MMDTQNLLAMPASAMFDELLALVRNFAVTGQFDDDVCLVGMDFIGLPPVKS